MGVGLTYQGKQEGKGDNGMSVTEAIQTEAQRAHLFAELAEAGSDTDRQRYAHKSHVAYLAMIRLERAS